MFKYILAFNGSYRSLCYANLMDLCITICLIFGFDIHHQLVIMVSKGPAVTTLGERGFSHLNKSLTPLIKTAYRYLQIAESFLNIREVSITALSYVP